VTKLGIIKIIKTIKGKVRSYETKQRANTIRRLGDEARYSKIRNNQLRLERKLRNEIAESKRLKEGMRKKISKGKPISAGSRFGAMLGTPPTMGKKKKKKGVAGVSVGGADLNSQWKF